MRRAEEALIFRCGAVLARMCFICYTGEVNRYNIIKDEVFHLAFKSKVSDAVVRRLPMYYRHLKELEREGIERISSRELGERMKLTASQIRQDINCFGGFGQQGYGYHVPELRWHIGEILGLEKKYEVIVVGAGNIGRAVANYDGFAREGFFVRALFDISEDLIGGEVQGIPVLSTQELPEWTKKHRTDIAVLAVPASEAQKTADLIVSCGIRAIWNFAPVDLELPEGVMSNHVHLSDSLHILTYRMNEEELFRAMEKKNRG